MTISRREFSRLGALGFAAHAFSTVPVLGQSEQKKIGYCVIGLGRIADHHMRGIAQSSTSTVTALVSGHRDKAEKIAAQYGVPKSSIYSYEDMDRIRENKAIDAVIVCLPNSMHAEYTSRSAKAGKHVLCEKPMAISVAECEAMISACKAANVKLMIAYRLHYEPLTLKTIKMIRDGAIGKVEAIDSANGFNIAPNEWRSTHALGGGGPLMDVGDLLFECHSLSHRRRACRLYRRRHHAGPRRPVPGSRGEPRMDDEVSLGRSGQLHDDLRRFDAGILQGIRIEGLAGGR